MNEVLQVLLWVLTGVTLIGCQDAVSDSNSQQKLNIVIIFSDDHSAWATGAYGNEDVLSPNIDDLAAKGAKFTNTFVSTPVCSPSRATFLTGLYSSQTGVNDVLFEHPFVVEKGLRPETTTWAEVLKNSGYSTGFIGKWNLGFRPKFHPTDHGFDYFAGYYTPTLRTPMTPTIEVDGEFVKFDKHTSNLFVDLAVDFMEAKRSQPFALVLALHETQEPWEMVPEEDLLAVKDIDPQVPEFPGADVDFLKKKIRDNYASVHALDRSVGKILSAIERLDLSDRTIVVYTSDHGMMIGQHGLYGRAFAKDLIGSKRSRAFVPNYYDEIVHIPLIVQWPGVIEPGTVIPQLVSNVDFFSSIIGMLDVEPPDNNHQEGIDFSPVLRGESSVTRNAVFFQHDTHTFSPSYSRGIRTEKWKLTRTYFAALGFDSLYDLSADRGETTNLINDPDYEPVIEQLQEQLTSWQKSINDPILPALECFKQEMQTGIRAYCDRFAYGKPGEK